MIKDYTVLRWNMHRYRVVDVFIEVAMEENPLAIFPDARGIAGARMQKIAQELNLSETAFVLPLEKPGCVARPVSFVTTTSKPAALASNSPFSTLAQPM